MLIFGLYDGERIALDVSVGMTVKEVREMIQTQLNISVDLYKHDKKVLVLTWGGSDLQDPWIFSDLGIVPGTTIRVNLKEEVKPVLHIHCSHSLDTISLYDTLVIGHMYVEELRSLASRKTGLPVGIFRLVAKDGKEMYDGHRLEDYGIDVGHTVHLENLDGWNEFLNLAVMGFTPQVVSQIATEENSGRYQMKVALFLAAHFGHVDLARAMLRQGIRASDPVGYPPQRMWCLQDGHIESKRAPVHQAVEMGQLGVLRMVSQLIGKPFALHNIDRVLHRRMIPDRFLKAYAQSLCAGEVLKLFVNHDITVVTAKDGHGLAPLNIALRKKIKNCASFLLTKQWSKVNVTKTFALHVGTYTHLRQWCERAKERAFMKYGHSKSSLKRRPSQSGPLVGFGVNVDGFSPSIMTGKSKAELQKEKERERRKTIVRPSMAQFRQMSVAELAGTTTDPEAYFKQVNAVQTLKSMGDKVKGGRWGRMARASSKAHMLAESLTSRSQVSTDAAKPQKSPEPNVQQNAGNEVEAEDATVRLPPIMQKLRARLVTQSNVTSDAKDSSQQQQVHVPAPPAGEKKEEKTTMMSKLMKSRGNAYFMTASSQASQGVSQQQNNPGGGKRSPQQVGKGASKVPGLQLPVVPEPNDAESQADTTTTTTTTTTTHTNRVRSQYGAEESIDTASTITTTAGEEPGNPQQQQQAPLPPPRPRRDTMRSLPDVSARADDVDGGAKDGKRRKKKKRKRVTSALLLSKAKSSEGSIPLPLISNEQDRRPFFYYNGQREDDVIDPTISTWSKHTQDAGTTPRERAIRSLTVANTFKDKPWLGQVQIALRIAANPTKRNVRRLRSASKRTFAIQ